MAAAHRLPDTIRACLFDLDGVLTDKASVHRTALPTPRQPPGREPMRRGR